jgi:hypothetical protein
MTPSRFREELKRFDKALDIEFNGAKGRWEIIGRDYKNVRYLIKKIPLGQMTTLGVATLKELYDCSPIKQGGAKRLNERIDDLIAAEEAAEEKELNSKLQERLEDGWQHLQYLNGYRVSLHIPEAKEEVIIRDRRRFHDEVSSQEGTTIGGTN